MSRSTAKFTISAEDRTKQAFTSAMSSINKLESQFMRIMAPVTALASTAGLGKLISETAKMGDMFDKMSQRTGIAVDQLSGLDYAAKISGSNIEAVEKSLKYLTNQMLDVSRGGGESKKTFDALGISVRGAHGEMRGTTDVLLDVAEKLSGIDDETLKAAYAMEIFGAKAGASLIPMLKQGRDGIEDLIRKNRELGGEWTTLESKQAAAFTDSLTDLKSAAGGLGRSLAIDLIPMLTDAANATAVWVANNRDFIRLEIKDKLNEIKDGLDSLAEHKDVIGIAIGGAFLATHATKLAVLSSALWGVVAAKEALVSKIKGSPLSMRFMDRLTGGGDPFGGGSASGQRGASASFDLGTDLKTILPVDNESIDKAVAKLKTLAITTPALPESPDLSLDDWDGIYSELLNKDAAYQRERHDMWLRSMETRIKLDYTGIEQQKELLGLWFADEYGMLEEQDERKILARQVLHGEIELLERDHLERLQRDNEQAVLRFGSQWGGMLYDMQRRSGNVFDNIVDGFSDMLQRMAMQAAMAEIFNLATGGAPGFGLGTVIKNVLGFRASGGPVRAGSPYVVGERGPELMVPGASGTILPAMKTAPTTIDNSRTTINAIWQSNQKPGAMDVYAFARMLRDADDLGLLDKMKRGGARG